MTNGTAAFFAAFLQERYTGTEMGTRLIKRKVRNQEGVTKPKMANMKFLILWLQVTS